MNRRPALTTLAIPVLAGLGRPRTHPAEPWLDAQNVIDFHLADGDWITHIEAFEDPDYGEGTHVYVWTRTGRVFRAEDADQLRWRVYENRWRTNVWEAHSDASGWRNV